MVATGLQVDSDGARETSQDTWCLSGVTSHQTVGRTPIGVIRCRSSLRSARTVLENAIVTAVSTVVLTVVLTGVDTRRKWYSNCNSTGTEPQ